MSHTVESLAADVRVLGMKPGDALMVHSSLKSIGWVEGGAESVIDAFLRVIGDKGVMFVPTLTATFATAKWEEMSKHVWDPAETPSRVGKITDTFWRRPNAFRSGHPSHSLAAIGKNAEALVKNHGVYATTFDKNGPYGAYVRMNATIVFVGTGMGCNTTLHAAEDWADLPYMSMAEVARVKASDGSEIRVPLKMSPSGHRSFYTRDDNSPAVQLLYKLGLVTEGKLGDAKVQMVRAGDVMDTVMKTYYEGDPAFLLCRKDDCEFCRKGVAACTEQLPRIRKTIEDLVSAGWCSIG